ncbi:MAG TPA: HAMP domain-containing sensor histidine kinase [Chryseolinea sp.]|nr:HAMP domain-containing sensor histidine kinase [Chryseolinea sp.]
MTIRSKILLYFSVVTIALVSAALFFINTLFYQYREQEFQQRQKDKIETTLKFLTQIKGIDHDIIEAMDRVNINDIYDEKLLIFDKNKTLVYSSITDTPIPFSGQILDALSARNPWIDRKDGLYDVVGVYIEQDEKAYYGISKAYDAFGYSKQNYLQSVLSVTLLVISLAVILTSYYLSKKITHSIFDITRQIKDFKFDGKSNPIVSTGNKDEIALLVKRFNELMHRMNEAFAFQKHAVHHISHELKTPIAVLVSDFEKIESETNPEKIKAWIRIQKENTKSLSEIINSLLEIAKAESGTSQSLTKIRIDELIFDLVGEIGVIHPEFQFSVAYSQNIDSENNLTVLANHRLMKAALSNLMLNCVQYSYDNKASISINPDENNLRVDLTNQGNVLDEKEQQFLFQHFFRGKNSSGKRGFGLGLVFIHKILSLYSGRIAYSNNGTDANTFTIWLPLS